MLVNGVAQKMRRNDIRVLEGKITIIYFPNFIVSPKTKSQKEKKKKRYLSS